MDLKSQAKEFMLYSVTSGKAAGLIRRVSRIIVLRILSYSRSRKD